MPFSMNQRVRDFDYDGSLVANIAEINAIIDGRFAEFGDRWVSAYGQLNPRAQTMDAAATAALHEAVVHMHRALFTRLEGPEWGEAMRRIVRDAVTQGATSRDLILCVDAMGETARAMAMKTGPDFETINRQFSALRKAILIQTQIICETMSAIAQENEKDIRTQAQLRLTTAVSSQIDSAATLGMQLNDQARDAARAARGMLDKASEVAAAAEQSAVAMREAAHTSSRLIRAIEDARGEVDGAAEVASRAARQAGEAVAMSATLSEHAQSIESILGLIRDIAGQTNLLALNATIEAARAGDAGRGFAVVAQEVKSLAQQTARATDDIAQKIGAIQNATRLSVDTNERIRATVEDVQTLGLRIRAAMDAQSQTVTMITAAVDETALAADSMSGNISAIRQDTEVVASEIDALSHGFSAVQAGFDALRMETDRYVRSAA
jgi:methyl-accepting chemotaxis protein